MYSTINPEMRRQTGQTVICFQVPISPSGLTPRCGCDTIGAFKAKQTPAGYGWLSLQNPHYPRCGYVFAIVLSYSHLCDSLCDYRFRVMCGLSLQTEHCKTLVMQPLLLVTIAADYVQYNHTCS